jgi:hypothetical protein
MDKYKFKGLNNELRENIIDYYSHRVAPTGSHKVKHAWRKTEVALQQLRTAKTETGE